MSSTPRLGAGAARRINARARDGPPPSCCSAMPQRPRPRAPTLPVRSRARSRHPGALRRHQPRVVARRALHRRRRPGPRSPTSLRNLGTGVLCESAAPRRICCQFAIPRADSDRVITRADLAAIRATLDAAGGAPSWSAILGAAHVPAQPRRRPSAPLRPRRRRVRRSPATLAATSPASSSATRSTSPTPATARALPARLRRPLARDAAPYRCRRAEHQRGHRPLAAQIERRTASPTRFFWKWRRLIDGRGARAAGDPGALGTFATDHFYRDCAPAAPATPYRCATVARLLAPDQQSRQPPLTRSASHARLAAAHGLRYRLAEINSAGQPRRARRQRRRGERDRGRSTRCSTRRARSCRGGRRCQVPSA